MEGVIKKYALENAVKFKGKANPGAVIGSLIQENPDVKKDMKTASQLVQKIVSEVNKLGLDKQKAELEKLAPELLVKKKKEKRGLFDNFDPLGKVITAFPPEPSKYPHIGHAKALLVNYEFAKNFDGEFILRFEDTNPELAKEEFYKIIEENVRWLGVNPDMIDYASDHMETFYEQAEKLIRLGKAYACTCSQEKVREGRMNGKPCDCRYKHIKEHLIMWSKMHLLDEGACILRMKIDLAHKNSTMRDPTIFRIIKKPHIRTKTKYQVWPNYDFENSVMDGLSGVTHRFRSKEFELRNELQRYIQRLLGYPETEIFEFARFNLKGVESSGRIIRELVDNKKLIGWDDPSLTTLVALKRRGFTKEAIKSFVLSTGLSKSESTLTWDDLIMHNKRVLDEEAERYFFIKDPVRIRIQDAPTMNVELHKHPHKDLGNRNFKTNELFYLSKEDVDKFKHQKSYRLMDCLNFVKKHEYYVFSGTDYADYKENGDMIIHWLPFSKDLIEVEVLMPDKKKITGLAEKSVWSLKEGDIIQFERFGFCRLDKKNKTKLYFWFTH